MSLRCLQTGLLVVLLCTPLSAQRNWTRSSFSAIREATLSFDNIDLSRLCEAGRASKPHLSQGEIEELVRENIRFLYFNKLNRGQFLVTPPPRHIVSKIERIVGLNAELHDLLESAGDGDPGLVDPKQRVRLVKEIGKKAKSMRRVFKEYFYEYSADAFLVKYGGSGDSELEFKQFLSKSREICGLIDQGIQSYFFKDEPSVVDAATFNQHSLDVLGESLYRLSRVTSKRLRSP